MKYLSSTGNLTKFFSLLNKAENYLSGGGVKELKVGIRPGAGTDTLASPKIKINGKKSSNDNDKILQWQFDKFIFHC